jgi:hypothetical protein
MKSGSGRLLVGLRPAQLAQKEKELLQVILEIDPIEDEVFAVVKELFDQEYNFDQLVGISKWHQVVGFRPVKGMPRPEKQGKIPLLVRDYPCVTCQPCREPDDENSSNDCPHKAVLGKFMKRFASRKALGQPLGEGAKVEDEERGKEDDYIGGIGERFGDIEVLSDEEENVEDYPSVPAEEYFRMPINKNGQLYNARFRGNIN